MLDFSRDIMVLRDLFCDKLGAQNLPFMEQEAQWGNSGTVQVRPARLTTISSTSSV